MAPFTMCRLCQHEYQNPADRRYHAQPDACFACGPHISWRTAENPGHVVWGRDRVTSDAIIDEAAALLAEGGIVAVKGLGGFHLACRATDDIAVRRLRHRKHRPTKPLAVMFARFDEMRKVLEAGAAERGMITGPRRPICLLRRRPDEEVPEALRLAPSVAGKLPEIGAMLPSTPLQYLLLERCGFPLVMTSGNLSDEPIICDDQIAVSRLMDVADAWIGNNRAITARFDDSVVRFSEGRPMIVRRARGFSPTPVRLPQVAASPEVLACGPEQKSTFCMTRAEHAFVSQHLGDLEDADTFDAWLNTLETWQELFGLTWSALACDMHPEYLSSKWARAEAERTGMPLIEVQHHHAHIASVLAENAEQGQVVGIALDGTGYGPDGSIWGGEILVCDQCDFVRAAHLNTWRLPGGAAAVKKPLRATLGLLDACGLSESPLADTFALAMGVEGPVVRQMMARQLNCPLTSSAGRLFDAVAALLGFVVEAGYEGEPACLLEAAACEVPDDDASELADVDLRYRLDLRPSLPEERVDPLDDSLVMDARPLIEAVIADLAEGIDPRIIARRFHRGFAEGIACASIGVARASGLAKVALGGGVFANRLILERVKRRLEEAGLTVLVPHDLPTNDGGISYGQAAVARARLARINQTVKEA